MSFLLLSTWLFLPSSSALPFAPHPPALEVSLSLRNRAPLCLPFCPPPASPPSAFKHAQSSNILKWSLLPMPVLWEGCPMLTTPIFSCVRAESLQSCPTLCNPTDCSLPGSSVHRILQARILEWVAISSSRGSSRPRDQTHISVSPALAGGFFTTHATWKALSPLLISESSEPAPLSPFSSLLISESSEPGGWSPMLPGMTAFLGAPCRNLGAALAAPSVLDLVRALFLLPGLPQALSPPQLQPPPPH